MTAIAIEGGKGPAAALHPVRIAAAAAGHGRDPDQGARGRA